MNYQQSRQRKTDGRWHWTNLRDEVIAPLGACANPQSPCNEAGHATDDEAAACYRTHLLDTRLRLGLNDTDNQHKCFECGAWTSGMAEVDMQTFRLCERHMTRECVDKHMHHFTGIIRS